jgi:hypothetical protein
MVATISGEKVGVGSGRGVAVSASVRAGSLGGAMVVGAGRVGNF